MEQVFMNKRWARALASVKGANLWDILLTSNGNLSLGEFFCHCKFLFCVNIDFLVVLLFFMRVFLIVSRKSQPGPGAF